MNHVLCYIEKFNFNLLTMSKSLFNVTSDAPNHIPSLSIFVWFFGKPGGFTEKYNLFYNYTGNC